MLPTFREDHEQPASDCGAWSVATVQHCMRSGCSARRSTQFLSKAGSEAIMGKRRELRHRAVPLSCVTCSQRSQP
eukprot:4629117-Alexandrium_andersonii.AAC.1